MGEVGNPHWKKGESANPGGKPRTQKKFQELWALFIHEKTGGTVGNYHCRKLYEFIEHADTHKIKFAALELALAYWMGKPHQMLEINATVDIADRLRKARERAGLPLVTPEEPLIVPDTDDESNPV